MPYSLIIEPEAELDLEGATLCVIAVFHGHCDPNEWQGRVL